MYKYEKKLFKGGDGFILKHNDTYYAYCTTENNLPAFTQEYPFFETFQDDGSDGIEVYTSKDLIHWENRGYCLKKGENVVGTHGFWAPEVSFYNEKFYMVYAVDEHITIAVADNPEGPFEKHVDGYLMAKPAIDGHLLFDDGCIYLYYVAFNNDNHICVAKMSNRLNEIEKYYESVLIEATEEWETIDGKITEGPFVIKHKGIYYLNYSANHTRCEDYAVGYATSTSPTGPFVKSKTNPILHKFDDIIGTGHHSFMKTDNDKYICIYHCHGGNISGFKPRRICLSEAEFINHENDIDQLVINQ